MEKKFITNLALLLFLNLLVKPFWVLGIDRTVQNVVGAESYGLYLALFNFSLIFNFLLDLGISNFNNRNIARHNNLLNKYFSNILVLKLMLALGYLIFTFFAAFVIGYETYRLKILIFLTINQFLLSLIQYLRSNISALHLFVTDSFISVLDRFLVILICSVLLWGNLTVSPFKIEWLVYAQTAAYLITALTAFFIVHNQLSYFKLRIDLNFLYLIIKQSYPFALLMLLMALHNRIDAILLERLLDDGNRETGIYAQAFRILDAACMFALLFASLLLPIFSKMIRHEQPVNELVKLAYLLLIVPAVIVSVSLAFYSQEVMDLLYHEHTDYSAIIFAILILSFVPIATSYIFGTLLTARGNLKHLNIIATIGVCLNLTLNIILIYKFKAIGVAIANVATQTVIALLQVIVAKKVFHFAIHRKLLLTSGIFVIGMILITFVIRTLTNHQLWGLVTAISCGFLLAFILGLIKPHVLYKIVKYKNYST